MKYLFLSRNSVEHVKNFDIDLHIVTFHNFWFSELSQRNKSCKISPQIKSDQIENRKKQRLRINLLSYLREPDLAQSWLRDSSRELGLIWMIYRLSPLSAKLSIAHLRAFLLLGEKSMATPMFLSPGIFSLSSLLALEGLILTKDDKTNNALRLRLVFGVVL